MFILFVRAQQRVHSHAHKRARAHSHTHTHRMSLLRSVANIHLFTNLANRVSVMCGVQRSAPWTNISTLTLAHICVYEQANRSTCGNSGIGLQARHFRFGKNLLLLVLLMLLLISCCLGWFRCWLTPDFVVYKRNFAYNFMKAPPHALTIHVLFQSALIFSLLYELYTDPVVQSVSCVCLDVCLYV